MALSRLVGVQCSRSCYIFAFSLPVCNVVLSVASIAVISIHAEVHLSLTGSAGITGATSAVYRPLQLWRDCRLCKVPQESGKTFA